MIRKIVAIAVIVLLLMPAICGCSATPEAPDTTPSQTQTEPVATEPAQDPGQSLQKLHQQLYV